MRSYGPTLPGFLRLPKNYGSERLPLNTKLAGDKMESECVVVVGSSGGMRLTLEPTVRAHAGASDYWDGNWLNCRVAVAAGGFRGEYGASLRAEEFVAFRRDLETLYDALHGQGGFHSMEEWVDLNVTGDGRGHFRGTCRLRDEAGIGNLLECQVEFDQSDIPAMLKGLRRIERKFPVLGKVSNREDPLQVSGDIVNTRPSGTKPR
jgi:hypothetical protein